MNRETANKPASIILCCGKERRLGRSKATVRGGRHTVIERTLDMLGFLCCQTVAVAAAGHPDDIGQANRIAAQLYATAQRSC